MSEQIAEDRACQIVKKEYGSAKNISSKFSNDTKGKQREFDKVFFDEESGKFIIIEAKGGSSPLGAAKGNQQGSGDYFEDLIEHMRDNGKVDDGLLDKLEAAKEAGLVDYLLVQQKFDDKTGDLLPTIVRKFKLKNSK